MLSRRAFVGSVAALAGGAGRAFAQSPVGQLWAGLEFIDTDGQTFRLSSLKQRLKLLNLWAHWCPGCLIEMPSLASLATAVGRDKLQIVLISNADDWRRDQLTARRMNLPFRLATPSPSNAPADVRAALLDREGAYVVPRTLLFAGVDNRLAGQFLGSRNWAEKAGQMRAQLG